MQSGSPLNWKITLEDIIKNHAELCGSARDLIEKKGKDYNRKFIDQNHLANICIGEAMGIGTTEQGLLFRLSDKFMRAISLAAADPEVRDESFDDTIRDIINYATYLRLIRDLRKSTWIPPFPAQYEMCAKSLDRFAVQTEDMLCRRPKNHTGDCSRIPGTIK